MKLAGPSLRRSGHRRPHHNRARSSGEQRGTTGKAAAPDKAADRPFLQVSPCAGLECPQLPKLRASGTVVTERPSRLALVGDMAAWLRLAVVGWRTNNPVLISE